MGFVLEGVWGCNKYFAKQCWFENTKVGIWFLINSFENVLYYLTIKVWLIHLALQIKCTCKDSIEDKETNKVLTSTVKTRQRNVGQWKLSCKSDVRLDSAGSLISHVHSVPHVVKFYFPNPVIETSIIRSIYQL